MLFPLLKLFTNCVPPAVVPIDIKYPVAPVTAFQVILAFTATFVLALAGEVKVVQAGIVTSVSVVKLSDVQPVAFPAVLKGVIVT